MLHSRYIRSLDDSSCENCPGTLETDELIFSQCPRAVVFWHILGIDVNPGNFRKSHLLGQSLGLPSEVKTDVMLLWHMWKARNSLIFDQVVLSPQNIIRRTISTMEQWTVRYRKLSLHWNVWIEFTLKI
ncbi:hypothetical protein HU200_040451 [Digitaria exilis]|uniref:Reverse transcriptase zinc-binding domain-containing protein n=1 Tax=Digitaria exilis TaxID=1010633 RepID=A0A835EEK0_9POAL|nr:hypothetical protein HU200_040451 [Digitaria exilis]